MMRSNTPVGLRADRKLLLRSKRRATMSRYLRLEALETRQLLSDAGSERYVFDVVAKAQPDEWFNGSIGQPYTALGQQAPGAPGEPKVNQDYLWGLTEAGDYLWFGTAGNALATASGAIGANGVTPYQDKVRVVEGEQSKYPAAPESLLKFLGDWRPPEIHRYNMVTGVDENLTPNDALIYRTIGIRSAGATDTVVLLAGPAINGTGMNVFAFDAQTAEYLGSRTVYQYADIRNWVKYNGQLYTGVLRTFSTTGEGSVLRWTGSRDNPFRFEEVGRLDAEAANMAVHDGRLYVGTWPLGYGTLMGILGYRSQAKAAIWMSPPLGTEGLTAAHVSQWQKVWGIEQFDPDPVISRSYGIGAMKSFDGYLYWGTMQVPGTGAVVFMEDYPTYDPGSEGVLTGRTERPAILMRGKDFDNPGGSAVQLLYGDSYLWKYTPGGSVRWALTASPAGAAVFGTSGLGDRGNYYVWSMAAQDDRLYVGTFDVNTVGIGNVYVDLGGDVNAIERYYRALGYPNVWMGADLLAMLPDQSGQPVAPLVVTRTGMGNPLNHGVRNLQATSHGLFLGSANCSNLLTIPPDQPLKAGGWELIQYRRSSVTITPAAGLETSETGGTASFTVVLDSPPTNPVTIALTSSDVSEGTVEPSSVTFTASNWNVPVPVTVTGVDDSLLDYDIGYNIVMSATVSTDPAYSGLGVPDVAVVNRDDERDRINVVDNGDAGFVKTGQWTYSGLKGYNGDIDSSAKGTGADAATWTFPVTPGRYLVSATWPATGDTLSSRTTNAPYRVYDGGALVGTVLLNQKPAPNDFTDQGVAWERLDYSGNGGEFVVSSSSLVVTLSDAADNYVIADAIRIERLGDPTPTLTVAITPASVLESAGSVAAMGTVTRTGPTTEALAVSLTSSDTGEATVPAAVTVPIGQSSTTFAVAAIDDAQADGTQNVTITAAAAGFGPGTAILEVTDNEVPVAQIVDDAGAGFSRSGAWTGVAGSGFQGDYVYSARGTGADVANWTFTVTPGQYEVAATWFPHANRATNAPYTVYDGSTSLGTVLVNQEQTPADFTDQTVGWMRLGTFSVTGSSLTVRLTDAANEYVIADGVRIERVGDPTPTLTVTLNRTSVVENAGSGAATGTVTRTGATTEELTVNLASSDTSEATVPAAVTIPAGQSSTTFAVAAVDDTATDGTQSVTITAAADGFDSGTATLQVADDEEPVVQIVDDGGAGFARSGAWTDVAGSGFQGDYGYSARGTGADVASWTFTVTPGRYEVAATWFAHRNRATNAPFRVYDGSTLLGTVLVNQEQTPADLTDQSVGWKRLGTFSVTGTDLVVRLTDAANEYVIADGVRMERVGDLPPTLTVAITPQSVVENAGGAAATGTVTRTGATAEALTISLSSSDTSEATVPATVTIPAGQSWATFAVSAVDDAQFDGTQNVTIAATAGGFDPGTASLQVTDNEEPVTQIVDDGGAGFSRSGAWTDVAGSGFEGDYGYSARGTGADVASWTFTVSPGRYEVAATWFAHRNRATNAPFRVYDGSTVLGTVLVNQEQTPADLTDQGVGWKRLGAFSVTGTTLIVRLTDSANEYVIADGVRVAPVESLRVDAMAGPRRSAPSLTRRQLAPIADEAIRRMTISSGTAGSELLAGVKFEIADLPDELLAETAGRTVRIDRSAAGYGWYLDRTPADDREFVPVRRGNEADGRGRGVAGQRVDLLTAVMHELGHILGWGHSLTPGLMQESLPVGQRRLPW